MSALFDIIVEEAGERDKAPSIRLGIRCAVGGQETVCPVSGAFESAERLEMEAEILREDLDQALDRARKAMGQAKEGSETDLTGAGSPEELWQRLAAVSDDGEFAERFNGLDEETRREVAEHVLTACNVFSGRPALFSSRYDADSALLRE
ncbi:MAG: hypothetical protein PVG49_16600 [Desulfobacteraceae bacterium]|jgi:hypothetical protein